MKKKYGCKYITNEEILGKENCPNFNSHSLELYTYKIKNLSDFFIQFNDDFFINFKVEISDFFNFKNNKIKYYYENNLLLGKPFSKISSKIIIKLNKTNKYYFWAIHSPRMFFKKDIKDFINLNKKNSIETKKSKFRNKKDIQLVYIYGYYLLSQNKGEFIFLNNISNNNILTNYLNLLNLLLKKLFSEGSKETLKQIYLQFIYKKKLYKDKIFSNKEIYSLISIGNNIKENKKQIDHILKNKIKFICLNDIFSTTNKELENKILKDNYNYFYKRLLKK